MEANIRWVVFDAEADSLSPTKFHCLSYKDHEGVEGTLFDYKDIQEFFRQYDCYVGHNIRRWDLPNLRRICEIQLPERIVDTLGLAWYLDPGRTRNGLEGYGEEFGIAKPFILDWSTQRLEDYVFRCEQDVEINHKLWTDQLGKLIKLYPNPKQLWKFLKYLDFKMYCAALAEESRWRLDVPKTSENLNRLSVERDKKVDELRAVLPRVPVTRTYQRPKKLRNSDGQLSLLGQRWQDRLVTAGLPEGYDGTVDEIVGETDGNPQSHIQIKDWLYSLGWVPETIKHVRDKKTGETKDIPQINKEHGAGICDSIKKLYSHEPKLEVLDGLSVLNHRIGILSGFLRDVDSDGYLRASVAGLTNTLRFKHAEIVNLPKPEKTYGSFIRECLVTDLGHELCGSDMASLEDRIKQHFLWPHDPDYVRTLNTDGYDPHLDIAVLAGGLTQKEADAYKAGDHSKKSVRSIFKNGNYACQYGAGIPRLMVTCGIDRVDAARLHKAYWTRNWAIKAVAEEQSIKEIDGQMWLFNPISGFYYSLRYEKDIFSTLVQGTAAYCFDTWLSVVLSERPQLTGQFHDEFILTVREGHRDEVTSFLKETIKEVNNYLKLNRELDISIQFGKNYAEIH